MNTQSENIADIALALSKVQGSIKHALKSVDNHFFKSKYADLPAVWEACKEKLSENEIAVFQGGEECNEGQFIFHTTLIHSSGQWLKSKLPISIIIPASPEKTDKYGKVTPASPQRRMTPQELGSSLTYFRRYGLCCAVGVCADEDDDGNKASCNEPPQTNPKIIGPKEILDLNVLLDKVPNYKSYILKHIKDQFSMQSIAELTFEMYAGIRSMAIYQASNQSPKIEKVG